MEWLTENKIPVGTWVQTGVDWVIDNASGPFDALSLALESMIEGLLFLIQLPHPLLLVGLLAALALWLRGSIMFALFVVLGLLFIINQGYWEQTTQTVALVLAATSVCMLVGVPVGIYAAHNPWFYKTIRPLLDLMQTIPTFVYLIPALILFGLGMVPGLIATVIFALPASIRLTQLGIASTPTALLEAADSFGATGFQRLVKIELPHATASIMAGLTQTIMLSLSMVVIAALVGAEGLGVPTLRALNTVDIGMGFEVGMAIVLVAIILDRFFRVPDEETKASALEKARQQVKDKLKEKMSDILSENGAAKPSGKAAKSSRAGEQS